MFQPPDIVLTNVPVIIEVIEHECHEDDVLDLHEFELCAESCVLLKGKGRFDLEKVNDSDLSFIEEF